MSAAESPIGDNLVRLRKARGLTQTELAGVSGVSVDVIARLEQHRKHGARWSTLILLANALGVQLPVLITPPALLGPHGTAAGSDLFTLRRALTSTGDLFADDELADDADLADPTVLSEQVRNMWRTYQQGDFALVIEMLPGLIGDARRLTDGVHADRAHRLLSTCYSAAAGVTVMRGHQDLAWTAVERAVAAARRTGSPLATTAASIFASWILLKQGRYADAESAALRAADRAEPSITRGSRIELATFGNLLVNAACAAVRTGAGDRAADHLSVARAAAGRYGVDGVAQWAVFGPRVVAMYSACNAVELHDFDAAVRAGSEVPEAAGGALPATWEARYLLNMAYAHCELGHDGESIELLGRARDAAPAWIGLHPLGHALVRDLLERSRVRSEQLADLARHLDVA